MSYDIQIFDLFNLVIKNIPHLKAIGKSVTQVPANSLCLLKSKNFKNNNVIKVVF